MRTAVLVICVLAVLAIPASSAGRSRRAAYPQRAMMFSGYFGRPVPAQYYPRGYSYGRPGFVTRGYEPQGAMTAFAAGNTVAAGSGFYGGGANDVNGNGNGNGAPQQPDCSQCNGNGNGALPPVSAEQPEPEAYPEPEPGPAPAPGQEDQPATSQEEQPALPPPESDETELPKDQPADQPQAPPPASGEAPQEETGRDITPKEDKKPAGRPPRRRPVQDDDDDDDDDELTIPGLPQPGKRRKGTGNSYNSYFPMVFGSYPGSRSGGEAPPGVATAIANSFSTGKGAVATSHATAYGGPHLLGNGNGSNGYRKNGSSARLRARS